MTTQIPAPQSVPTGGAGSRRVVKVSPATIAAARAQVTLSKALGKPVPAAVSKIAGVR